MVKETKSKKSELSHEVQEFIESYSRDILDDSAALFLGAGFSRSVGFVDWKGLMKGIAKSLKLDIDKETDLVSLAQFHANEAQNRGFINRRLVEAFDRDVKLSENHHLIARLPIKTIWTTNYDKLVEEAFRVAGRRLDVKFTQESLARTRPGRDATYYKMHGDVDHADKAVITKDDYESYNDKGHRQLFTTTLQGDLVDKTFLFIGFSFADPNISYILSRIRILLGENPRPHYCIFKKLERKDFKSKADYDYAQIRQSLQIKDLKRYSIHALLIDNYDQIRQILKAIELKVRRKRVFISGSAHTYAPMKENVAVKFMNDLSHSLLREGYQVSSGFGLGVGDSVINGALRFLDENHEESIEDRLILRPFPQVAPVGQNLKDLWTNYRTRILEDVGIAIFIFGNKVNPDDEGRVKTPVLAANGMREEFKIAVAKGIRVIPVGNTGWISKELWDEVYTNFGVFFPDIRGIKTHFENLGKASFTPSKTITEVLSIIDKLNKE